MKHLLIAGGISFLINYLTGTSTYGVAFFCLYPIVGLGYMAYKDRCAKKLGAACACKTSDVACRYEKEKSEI